MAKETSSADSKSTVSIRYIGGDSDGVHVKPADYPAFDIKPGEVKEVAKPLAADLLVNQPNRFQEA